MYDLLTAIALICVIAGMSMIRVVPLHQRVWTGLALAGGSYCAAMAGLFLIRAGFDSHLLRYAWAGSFGTTAILAIIFLVPSAQDLIRARWRQARLHGMSVR
jgi:hypothetical protein